MHVKPNSRKERWAEFKVLAGFDANKAERKPRQFFIVHDPCLWPMGCGGRNNSRDCRDCGCDCD